ncbi:phage tail protein [Cupriavidus campinensis]
MANDFLVFGGAGGANVITQAAYAALGARASGFSSGTANSAQCNKTWRQSSIMAAVLAQFISDRTGQDVLDDGTTATILANLKLSAAAVNGDATKTFSVAAATLSTHAMQLGQAVGRYLGTRVFTANGTYTPTAGTTGVIVECIGGGGPGGSTVVTSTGQIGVGGGGGAGGCARSYLTTGFSGVSMTIGAGAAPGGNGGTTSFGALLSATGGAQGGASPAAAPPYVTINGYGGSGSGGNLLNSKGGDGTLGIGTSVTSFASGAGGSSILGAGGGGQPTTTGGGVTAITRGSGGGGALNGTTSPAQTGGSGAAGAIIVHEFS